MKRTLSLLLALALLLGLLSACGGQAPSDTAVSPPPADQSADAAPAPDTSAPDTPAPEAELSVTELAELVFPYSGCTDPDNVQRLSAGEDAGTLAFYIENAYALEEGEWEDAAIIRATGASAFELTVLRCSDGDAAVRAAAKLVSYIFARQGDFAGYAPAEADMAANGCIAQNGPFAALFICPEPSLAEAAFHAALDGTPMPDKESFVDTPAYEPPQPSNAVQWPNRVVFTAPNIDDMSLYDTAAIRAAWEKGDPDRLSDYDRDIYDAAEAILKKELKNGMSDYEKEAALYEWVVQNVNYDWTHQDVLADTPRESFTPYGGLVNQTAVCLGYAASFQLLMDLAGVECITVAGAAFLSTEDHGWNVVRLDGNWYCVDATWDANWREYGLTRGRPSEWRYFNVTSDYMAQTDHQWDYSSIPEAVTGGNGR